MSKKAAEVVEAAPKYKQPWQGFLVTLSILVASYAVYQWLLNPVWGLLTKMILGNVMVAFTMASTFVGTTLSQQLALVLAINNPMFQQFYPMGYLVDWSSLFIMAIVWAISLVVLIKPGTTSKQPWTGIYILILSVVLGFATWYILGFKLQWTGVDIILLGVCGFLVLASEAMIFGYWPFSGKREDTHPVGRGVTLIILGWILTFLLRWVLITRVWANPMGNFLTMYLWGNLDEPLFSLYPLDFMISGVIAVIFAMYIISIIGPFSSMSQPKRGIINFIIALFVGIIMWIIVVAIALNKGTTQTLIFDTVSAQWWVLTTPSTNFNLVSTYLTFPFITMLFGHYVFNSWPWTRFGRWSNLIWVIVAFIIGSILYYLIIVNPGYAYTITGANLITAMSGEQSLYLNFFYGVTGVTGPNYQTFGAFLIYFEGLAKTMSTEIIFAWMFYVQIFFIMIFEGLEHWPWK